MSYLKTLAAASLLTRWSFDLNTVSYHTRPWARQQLNQVNSGAGIEYQFSPDWSGMAGIYRNSYRRTTAYALAAL